MNNIESKYNEKLSKIRSTLNQPDLEIDLYFTGNRTEETYIDSKNKHNKIVLNKRKVIGQLFFPNTAVSYKAISGSLSPKPLPNGFYKVTNVRTRDSFNTNDPKTLNAMTVYTDLNYKFGETLPNKYDNLNTSFNFYNTENKERAFSFGIKSNLEEITKSDIFHQKVKTAWSADLNPMFKTGRTALRIHPDGGVPGTEGCIGIINLDADKCYNSLRTLISNKKELLLLVDHDDNNLDLLNLSPDQIASLSLNNIA